MTEQPSPIDALQWAHPRLDLSACGGNSWIPQGWYTLVDELCGQIEATMEEDAQLKVHQIKEKLGTLRFYANASESIAELILQAEQRSAETCMWCGQPGRMLSLGVIFTLCPTHEAEERAREERDEADDGWPF